MIKVNYNTKTTLVQGYYPDTIDYSSIPTPFIEINESEQVLGKQMCVIDGVYQEYVKPLDIQLQEAKEAKIKQLKANRDLALEQPQILLGKEWETGNEVNFAFRVKATGNPITDPSTIISQALQGRIIKYSCFIGNNQGYIELDQATAQNIADHLSNRGTTLIGLTNELEKEIEDCETLKELENININFE